jgi:basic amino acid/polyamine antiporter, APA family
MDKNRQLKPGDVSFRPRRIKRFRLKRVLGVSGLFSAGYGDVGSSIYYGLGIVALVAMGGTPIALGIAGIIYIFNAFTYSEGSAMIPEGGGSASYARLAFNDLFGFIAGWSLMLSYVATMAISAFTIPPYLSYFWPVLKNPAASTFTAMGIIVLLMLINIFGVKESSRLNILFISISIVTQLILVIMGIVLILIPNPGILVQHMFGPGNFPTALNLIFGIALAALCFTGVETVSQLAEETRQPQRRIPQAYILMIFVVIILFAGISVVALSAMTPAQLAESARDPVAGIATSISFSINPEEIASRISHRQEIIIVMTWVLTGLRNMLPFLVAILASSILLIATNAGLLGISRLTYNLSSHHLLPGTLSRVHSRFRTPYIAIFIFCLVSVLLLIPGFNTPNFFTDLGALYVFGSLLTFAMAHLSILALRIKKPGMQRPFKLAFNIKFRGKELPITAILGLVSTLAIWLVIIIIQPNSRWAGLIWMSFGLLVFYMYRRHARSAGTVPNEKPPQDEQISEKINADRS